MELERYEVHEYAAEHIPGVLNDIADALSRLATDKQLPTAVHACAHRTAPERGAKSYKAWSLEPRAQK